MEAKINDGDYCLFRGCDAVGGTKEACKAAGINAIVDKPIKFDRIKQAIESITVTCQE